MEIRARLNGISRDLLTGKWMLTVATDDAPNGMDKVQNQDLAVSIRPYRKRRTLTSNAYYWELVGKLAGSMRVSNNRMHNMLLRRYGQTETMDGQLICLALPDTDKTENDVLEKETYHLRPTSKLRLGNNGEMFRLYVMLRGSHDYNTEEFSKLLDGTIDECKAVGIETLPPGEIERMMAAYEANRKHSPK